MDNIVLLKIEIGLAWIVTLSYGISFAIGLKQQIFSGESRGQQFVTALRITAGIHVVLILLRSFEVQRLPLQTIYESISWLVVTTTIIYLTIHSKLIKRHSSGVIISGLAFSVFLYSLISRDPFVFTTFTKFNSQWFELHTLSAFLAYALFTVGFSVELCHTFMKNDPDTLLEKISLNKLTYKLIASAFSFLTCSILLGMIWANDLWGVYWIWEPKLTWTLIMWINYAAYLHSRVVPWLNGMPSAMIHISGYMCLVFSFIGTEWFTTTVGTLQKCHMSL